MDETFDKDNATAIENGIGPLDPSTMPVYGIRVISDDALNDTLVTLYGTAFRTTDKPEAQSWANKANTFNPKYQYEVVEVEA